MSGPQHPWPVPVTLAGGELRRQFLDLVDMMSALRMLLSTDSQPSSETGLLRHAIQALGKHVRMDACTVFLVEGSVLKGAMRYSAFDNLGDGIEMGLQDEVFQLSEGMMGEVCRGGEPRFSVGCDKTEADRRLCMLHGGDSGNALLSLPMKQADQVLGVLNILLRHPNQFDAWHHNAFALFADGLSQSLSNFRLVSDLDAKVDRRTRVLQKALDEAQALRRRFERLSSIDEMTGLYNRRYFFDAARAEVSRSQRQQADLTLVLLDIDQFKQINDTWGHAVGDEVLVAASEALRQVTRDEDIVARVGGEEFVILLPDTAVEGIPPMLERLRECFAALSFVHARDMPPLRASLGVTKLRPELSRLPSEEVLDQLYLEADRAMYYCKTHGRDCWKVYDESIGEIGASGRP